MIIILISVIEIDSVGTIVNIRGTAIETGAASDWDADGG